MESAAELEEKVVWIAIIALSHAQPAAVMFTIAPLHRRLASHRKTADRCAACVSSQSWWKLTRREVLIYIEPCRWLMLHWQSDCTGPDRLRARLNIKMTSKARFSSTAIQVFWTFEAGWISLAASIEPSIPHDVCARVR